MGSYGLLGKQLSHSFSPFIHGELGGYEYQLYEKTPDELDSFFADGKFHGINVTIPYKKDVIQYCQSLSKAAQTIGSVNTIIRRPEGTFHGDNTDYYGFAYLLDKTKANFFDGKTIILGGGGSSLTVQAVLRDRNSQKNMNSQESTNSQEDTNSQKGTSSQKDTNLQEIVIISRGGNDNYENIHKHYDANVIINTTPVGMYPNNGLSPIDLKMFRNCQTVIDLIYNPAKTELLLQADELGIENHNGLSMLVAQAKKAAELFTNTVIDDSKLEEIISKIYNKTRNIVLIGMPGCGKTTIGKALSDKTGRKFVDSDDMIVETAGKPIPDIFAEDGEDAFRKIETDVLKTLCKDSGLIIATGGGIVTRPENRNIIRQNGVVVYLDRRIKDLPISCRPLSMRDGIEALAATRLPLYEKWSDVRLSANDIKQVVDELHNITNNRRPPAKR